LKVIRDYLDNRKKVVNYLFIINGRGKSTPNEALLKKSVGSQNFKTPSPPLSPIAATSDALKRLDMSEWIKAPNWQNISFRLNLQPLEIRCAPDFKDFE
jgi:hypothetical protein